VEAWVVANGHTQFSKQQFCDNFGRGYVLDWQFTKQQVCDDFDHYYMLGCQFLAFQIASELASFF
jgi:hypothetical protein